MNYNDYFPQKVWLRLTLASLYFLMTLSNATADNLPKFEDFATPDIFEGKPVTPLLTERWAIHYQGQINSALVNEHPNFGGHYYVILWGCGSGCAMMVIEDALTGKIYPPPLNIGGKGKYVIITLPNFGSGFALTEYHQDSRLFILKSCPAGWGDLEPYSGTSYFEMTEVGFKLIRRLPCTAEELDTPH